MPTARDHLTAQIINGRFYAIAGRAGGDLRANEEYDPATRVWRTRTPAPTARGGLGSGALRNRIQVFGGEGNSGTPENTFAQHEEYDPVSDTWATLTLMPTPRHGLYGVTLANRVFAPGGGPRAGAFFSAAHEAYFPQAADPPVIREDGIRNAASLTGALAPGAIAAVMGSRFAYAEQVASRFPIATQMNAITVRVNGTAVPLLYVGPDQINFHLPYTLTPGPLNITVTNVTSESAVVQTTGLVAVAPAIFAMNARGEGQGAVLIANTGLLAAPALERIARPARRGEIVEIYATGLGRVDALIAPGAAAPSARLANTVETPVVTIGGARADVSFSGLTPGAIGLYQVNARIAEQSATGGAIPVSIQIGDRASNTVTIAVSQ
jgi:uncharacterized protein (TIGR03437 family)